MSAPALSPAAVMREKGVALRHRSWARHALRNQRLIGGALLVTAIVLAALLLPIALDKDPNFGDFSATLAPPSADHLFGTDYLGRDILARVLYGYRVSLVVAVASVAFAILIGAPLGLFAGYFSSRVDNLLMRPLDLLMAFPPLLLAVTLVAVFGTRASVTIAALAIIYIPIMARVTRGSVVAVRHEEFVDAAKAIGADAGRIMTRHILPNSVSPLIVQASISMGIAILIEAALSFIGLGTQPPDPSLGSMLAENKDFMTDAWWTVTFPGLAIMSLVLGFNLLGDGLREMISPQRR
jgi:peptide/nickel transport system permease protein